MNKIVSSATEKEHIGAATLPHKGSVAVLTIFTVDPQHENRFTELAHDFLVSHARWQRGLNSIELFTDESGQRILTLARWKDRAWFEAFKQSDSGRHATELVLSLRPQVFFLQPAAFIEGGR